MVLGGLIHQIQVHVVQGVLDLIDGAVRIPVKTVSALPVHVLVKPGDAPHTLHLGVDPVQVAGGCVSGILDDPWQGIAHAWQLIHLVFQVSEHILLVSHGHIRLKLPHDAPCILPPLNLSVIPALVHQPALAPGNTAHIVPHMGIADGPVIFAVPYVA